MGAALPMAEVALTSPLAREGAALRQQRVYMSAVLSAVLLALALVAVSTLDGSSTAVAPLVLTGAGAPGNTDIEDADISQEDEEQAIENMQDTLDAQPTQVAAHIRGTQPTDEVRRQRSWQAMGQGVNAIWLAITNRRLSLWSCPSG